MSFQLPAVPGGILGAACTFAGIVTATVMISNYSNYHKLSGIPEVGSNGWFDSWWAGRKFNLNDQKLIQEGYRKYNKLPFKVADRFRWWVVVGSRKHIEELRKAPDDTLSLYDAANDAMKFEYTMSLELIRNPYHANILRTHLTRNLSNLYPDVRDEISAAFGEILNLQDDGWKSVPLLNTVQKVVCRASNRIFVGLPLCRDPDWVDINLRFTFDVVGAAYAIRLFTNILAPLVVNFMTELPTTKKRAMKHLGPVIEEHMKLIEKHGKDWTGRSNDMISWMLEVAPEGPERTLELLTTRMLAINFGAIHTSSSTFVYALFYLAAYPQYIQPLREEVEAVVAKEGWTKASLAKMHKIDSFMRESQRLVKLSILNMGRLALKDFKFSDGTFIPKGTVLAVPSGSLHFDDEHYENAEEFIPFRFSDMRDENSEDTRHLYVSTSPEYVPFGHGKHACPGRFFAGSELKSMLAHIVVSYEVKLEDNVPWPDMANLYANSSLNIQFRKRTN